MVSIIGHTNDSNAILPEECEGWDTAPPPLPPSFDQTHNGTMEIVCVSLSSNSMDHHEDNNNVDDCVYSDTTSVSSLTMASAFRDELFHDEGHVDEDDIVTIVDTTATTAVAPTTRQNWSTILLLMDGITTSPTTTSFPFHNIKRIRVSPVVQSTVADDELSALFRNGTLIK